MSRDSNSHFEGAIILDDDGVSPNNTGPISYFGFDKSPNATDESNGPRISGGQGFGDNPAFLAPRGSIYLPGLGQWVWHNIDGTTTGWVRLLQDGSLPAPLATPTPTMEGVITIDLPDTGAVLTQTNLFPFPNSVRIGQVIRATYYKLEASGTANVTVQTQFTLGPGTQDFHAAPVALNVGWAAGFMSVVNPADLFQDLTANVAFTGGQMNVIQTKSVPGENNAVRVVVEVIGG